MEGLLWKWTNYWSGWQPRWFILDNGILSYYNSQDEVGKGCRGSIKISVCNVLLNHSDPCQLELEITKEQHFYLKAANEKERQQWLVALGSCKAMLQTLSDPTNYISEKDQRILNSGVKQKKSELRIYCDLLMQQVLAIKEAGAAEPIDVTKIEQCSVLLSETCDTFINTLEDCMKLAEKPARLRSPSEKEVTKPSSPVNPGMKHILTPHSPTHDRAPPRSILRTTHRSVSQSSTSTDTDVESQSVSSKSITTRIKETEPAYVHPSSNSNQNTRELSDKPPAEKPVAPQQTNTLVYSKDKSMEESAPQIDLHQASSASTSVTGNFFNSMGSSFVIMLDDLEDGVKTKDFTACSAELAKLFDKLSSTAFSPVKNDLLGNVKKIEQKWTTDPKALSTLQKIVNYEIKNGQHLDPNSATQALLWLTRGLLFVANIVMEYPQQDSMYNAVSLAYERTLKPFHNFVVRGVVSIGLRALPYKDVFIQLLSEDPSVDTTSEAYRAELRVDGNRYQQAVKTVCQPIIEFYRQHNMIIISES